MRDGVEAVFAGQSPAKGDHLVAGEFEDSAASMANHVIVGVFAESQLVVRLFDVESNLFEDSAFDQQLLPRLRSVCSNHINFYTEQVREKFVNTAEVQKLNNAELRKDNSFRFVVESGTGVHIIPISKVKF